MIQLSEHGMRKWRGKLAKLLTLTPFALCLGCTGVSSVDGTGSGLSQQDCASFQALLLDPEFQTVGDRGSVWRYTQHTGERSFSTLSEDGTLTFARIGGEPWAVLSQKIQSPLLSGRQVVYSVDLKLSLIHISEPTRPY